MGNQKFVVFFLLFVLHIAARTAAWVKPFCDGICVAQRLGPLLSKGASINTSHLSSVAPRWSEFHAPRPGTVVNVATEKDVLTTVIETF